MATASHFEAYAPEETFEPSFQGEAAPRTAAPAIVSGVGKGYREITDRRSAAVHPIAALLAILFGVALGGGTGLLLTTGHLSPAALFTVRATATVKPPQQPLKPEAITPKPATAPMTSAAAPSSIGKTAETAAEAPTVTASPSKITVEPPTPPTIRRRPSALHRAATTRRPTPKQSAPAQNAAREHPSAIRQAPESSPVVAIEGDVTVAEFDESSGRIETREGKSFILGASHLSANAIPWEEFRSNLHYRCNTAGNCSLWRAGATAPESKLGL